VCPDLPAAHKCVPRAIVMLHAASPTGPRPPARWILPAPPVAATGAMPPLLSVWAASPWANGPVAWAWIEASPDEQ
jgi:hypothetical protein